MKSNDAELASQGRRLAGAVLDGFLFVLTLGIGWVIWYLIVARGGQSPAKQLLRTRVIRGDGQWADLGWMLIRDLVVRAIAFGAVNGVLVAVLGEEVGGAICRAYLRRCSVVVRMGQRPPVRMGQDRAHASCKRSQSIAALCNRPAVKADHSESGVPSRTSPVRSPNSLVKGRSGDVPERTLAPLDFGRVDV